MELVVCLKLNAVVHLEKSTAPGVAACTCLEGGQDKGADLQFRRQQCHQQCDHQCSVDYSLRLRGWTCSASNDNVTSSVICSVNSSTTISVTSSVICSVICSTTSSVTSSAASSNQLRDLVQKDKGQTCSANNTHNAEGYREG